VFGAENTLSRNRDAVDHVIARLNIKLKNIVGIKNCMVIVKRNTRRILNIDDLKKTAIAVGIKHVLVVELEKMIVKSQISLAANCRIMVGVQGAGLQWAIFMPPGSTLIEISWKYWKSFYGFVETYNIEHVNLIATDVHVNWQDYELHSRHGKKCSNVEKLQLLNIRHSHNWETDNIWRHADVTVDREEFTKIMKRVLTNKPKNYISNETINILHNKLD